MVKILFIFDFIGLCYYFNSRRDIVRIRAEAEDLIPTISSMGKKACTRNKRMVGTSEQEPD